MIKVDPITTLTVDDKTFAVAALSENSQRLVAVINDWRVKEAEARGELLLIQSAIRDIQRELTASVQSELAKNDEPTKEENADGE